MECPNCEEEAVRLIEPALLRLPIDMSGKCDGETVRWKEPGAFSLTSFIVTIKNSEPLVHVWDANTEPMCHRCFNHAVWPDLYPYIANKPSQLILDGWHEPIWQESAVA